MECGDSELGRMAVINELCGMKLEERNGSDGTE